MENWDEQREAMYNGWAGTKIFLEVKKEVDIEKSKATVIYENIEYSETFFEKDLIGSANAFNQAYNRLVYRMLEINKNIELKYPIK